MTGALLALMYVLIAMIGAISALVFILAMRG